MAASASGAARSAVSRTRRYQQLWYADGLNFSCTQCGKCCYGASQRQITLNEAEQQSAADHLSISRTDFASKFIIAGTDRLKANNNGACALLDGGKCSIHPVRPTQCATYPFWGPHLASAVDWKGVASQCEGISIHQSPSKKSQTVSTREKSLKLMEEFRASPQAGHGVAPPGKVTPAQVVKALIMNDIHATGEYPETSQQSEQMLGAALGEIELREIIKELSGAQRVVVHSDDHITVLDSMCDTHWQRDVVLNSCPGHTQSCVTLKQAENGELGLDHSQLPRSTPVFQMLAACIPGLQGLRQQHHPNTLELQAPTHKDLQRSERQSHSDESSLHQVGVKVNMNIAVIGAGACSIPAHLTHGSDDVVVHAVDVDERMLDVAKQHMGVKEHKNLKLFHADGLDFIRSDFNSSTRGIQGYDAIILDVAVPAKVTEGESGSSVLAPAPEFLGDRFLGDAVWRRLRPDGMLIINALGPADYLQQIQEALTRHAHVFTWQPAEGDTNVLIALPTCPPSPESVQLEAWDNVWGNGNVKYWDPKLVTKASIISTILRFSSQDNSVVRDVRANKAQNYESVPSYEEDLTGTEPSEERRQIRGLGG